MTVMYLYLPVLSGMTTLSWMLAGSVERSLRDHHDFWLRMNVLTCLWMAPLVASPFAWAFAADGAGRTAALLTVSISVSMMIAAVGRMVVMQGRSGLDDIVGAPIPPQSQRPDEFQ